MHVLISHEQPVKHESHPPLPFTRKTGHPPNHHQRLAFNGQRLPKTDDHLTNVHHLNGLVEEENLGKSQENVGNFLVTLA